MERCGSVGRLSEIRSVSSNRYGFHRVLFSGFKSSNAINSIPLGCYPALDRRTLLRMIGKVPQTFEKLQKETQCQLAAGSPGLPCPPTYEDCELVLIRENITTLAAVEQTSK